MTLTVFDKIVPETTLPETDKQREDRERKEFVKRIKNHYKKDAWKVRVIESCNCKKHLKGSDIEDCKMGKWSFVDEHDVDTGIVCKTEDDAWIAFHNFTSWL